MRLKLVSGPSICFFLLLLGGCASEVILHDSADVLSEAYKETTSIVKPGVTPRSVVRSMLGAPVLDDERLRIEVYQESRSDDVLLIANFVPLPAGESEFHAYFLVIYNQQLIVEKFDYFFISEPSKGQAQLREYSDTGQTQIDNFTFGAYWKNEGKLLPDYKSTHYLFISYASQEQTSQTATDLSYCQIYLTASGEILESLALDNAMIDDTIVSLIQNNLFANVPYGGRWGEGQKVNKSKEKLYIIRFLLTPGLHSIAAKWILDDAETKLPFECAGGDAKYLHIFSSSSVSKYLFWRSYKMNEYGIRATDTVPESFAQGELLFYVNSNRVDGSIWPAE